MSISAFQNFWFEIDKEGEGQAAATGNKFDPSKHFLFLLTIRFYIPWYVSILHSRGILTLEKIHSNLEYVEYQIIILLQQVID